MSSNTAKYKNYQDGVILFGPSGAGQNLNDDLQKNLADYEDAVLVDMIGQGAVVLGMPVQTTTGLAVQVGVGTAFVSGQRVRSTLAATVSSLPANTTGIQIYVEAGTPFNLTHRAWPASFGFTTGGLGSDQLLLGTVNTDGTGVTLITDGRVFLNQLINAPTATEKAALAGTGAAPSGSNPFVTNDDARLAGMPNELRLTSPDAAVHTITVSNAGILSLLGQILTAYIAQTITAQHTFNPGSAAPPFALGVNAHGQLVIGLNADLLDGQEGTFYQNATNIIAGLLDDARLSTNIPRKNANNIFTAQQTISPASVLPPFTLGSNAQGQLVLGLNADKLDGQEGAFYQALANATGTLADARLSSQVPLKNVQNTFVPFQILSGGAGISLSDPFWAQSTDPKHACHVYHTLDQTIANDELFHTLLFNSERIDTTGTMHSTVSNTSRITIPQVGLYRISWNIRFQANATGTYRAVRTLRNGVSPMAPYVYYAVAQNSLLGGSYVNGSMVWYFGSAGSYVEVQVAHDASAALEIIANDQISPEFAVEWIRS